MERNPKKARVTCRKEYKQALEQENASQEPNAEHKLMEVWEVSDGETESEPLQDVQPGWIPCCFSHILHACYIYYAE